MFSNSLNCVCVLTPSPLRGTPSKTEGELLISFDINKLSNLAIYRLLLCLRGGGPRSGGGVGNHIVYVLTY